MANQTPETIALPHLKHRTGGRALQSIGENMHVVREVSNPCAAAGSGGVDTDKGALVMFTFLLKKSAHAKVLLHKLHAVSKYLPNPNLKNNIKK